MTRILPALAALLLLAGCTAQVASNGGASGATLYSSKPEAMLKPVGEGQDDGQGLVFNSNYEKNETAGSLIATQ